MYLSHTWLNSQRRCSRQFCTKRSGTKTLRRKAFDDKEIVYGLYSVSSLTLLYSFSFFLSKLRAALKPTLKK